MNYSFPGKVILYGQEPQAITSINKERSLSSLVRGARAQQVFPASLPGLRPLHLALVLLFGCVLALPSPWPLVALCPLLLCHLRWPPIRGHLEICLLGNRLLLAYRELGSEPFSFGVLCWQDPPDLAPWEVLWAIYPPEVRGCTWFLPRHTAPAKWMPWCFGTVRVQWGVSLGFPDNLLSP